MPTDDAWLTNVSSTARQCRITWVSGLLFTEHKRATDKVDLRTAVCAHLLLLKDIPRDELPFVLLDRCDAAMKYQVALG